MWHVTQNGELNIDAYVGAHSRGVLRTAVLIINGHARVVWPYGPDALPGAQTRWSRKLNRCRPFQVYTPEAQIPPALDYGNGSARAGAPGAFLVRDSPTTGEEIINDLLHAEGLMSAAQFALEHDLF